MLSLIDMAGNTIADPLGRNESHRAQTLCLGICKRTRRARLGNRQLKFVSPVHSRDRCGLHHGKEIGFGRYRWLGSVGWISRILVSHIVPTSFLLQLDHGGTGMHAIQTTRS